MWKLKKRELLKQKVKKNSSNNTVNNYDIVLEELNVDQWIIRCKD